MSDLRPNRLSASVVVEIDNDLRLRKLKWLCRRGMKELDVLLSRFIENQSRALQDQAWPELERLLASEDDQLWLWVQNPAVASREYQQLLTVISHGPAHST